MMFLYANVTALFALVTVLAPTAAQAADNTRYVSTTGRNANACTLAAPCRTLHKGISATPVGGELRILDSGFYGNNATIRKSLTISGNGNTVYLGTAITIDDAAAVVALRGLALNGQGTIARGIEIAAAASVYIERCVVHRFTAEGIRMDADAAHLFVTDTTVRENGSLGLLTIANATSWLTVDNSRFETNGATGLLAQGFMESTVTRSIFSGNSGNGFVTFGGRANVTSSTAAHNTGDGFRPQGGPMTVESSVARGNGGAGFATFGNTLRISNSVSTDNAIGIRNNGGTVRTRENNTVEGNTTDVDGTLTPVGGT
jgi:hypothetical protein